MAPAPPALSLRQLNRATLARQGLLEPLPRGPMDELVHRLGSLQAQHPDWPPFALHTRLAPGAPRPDLLAARRRKQVVRASLMRLTVHAVARDDFWPMSTVTLHFRRRQWRIMFKQDPATSPLGRRIAAAHPAVVTAMRQAPRGISEVEAILAAELQGVDIPPNRCLWRHFSGAVQLVHAPVDDERYGRQRYVPAADWLGEPEAAATDAEAAARHVAQVYLAAFGPASVEDLVAYVGRGDAIARWRRAVATLGDRLVHFTGPDGRSLVDLVDAPRPDDDVPVPPRLLARWDSLLLAHEPRHRTRVLPEEHRPTIITKNADVLPTFLLDGFVAGSWLPKVGPNGEIGVELRPFGRLAAADRDALEADAARLAGSLGRGAAARYPGTD